MYALNKSTVERLDGLRVEDESYDEGITELINIYYTEELTLFHGGDEHQSGSDSGLHRHTTADRSAVTYLGNKP
jgi:hypothetical protein